MAILLIRSLAKLRPLVILRFVCRCTFLLFCATFTVPVTQGSKHHQASSCWYHPTTMRRSSSQAMPVMTIRVLTGKMLLLQNQSGTLHRSLGGSLQLFSLPWNLALLRL